MEQLKRGGMAVPRIEFSEDGSILAVVDWVDRPSLCWYARTYAPDGAGIALVIALMLACVLLVRGLRRQRERGRIYCRKCNQELVAPQVRVSEEGGVEVCDGLGQCPECGVVLGSALPVMGRGRARRSLPLAIGALVIAVGFVGVIVWSTRPIRPGGQAWPFAGVERAMMGFARERVWIDEEPVTRIRRWSLPEMGVIDERVVRRGDGIGTWVLPDGRREVRISTRDRVATKYVATIRELATGREWSIDLCGLQGGYGGGSLVGFDSAGDRAYLSTLSSTAAHNGEPFYVIWELDIPHATKREIAHVEVPLIPSQGPAYSTFFVTRCEPLEWCGVIPAPQIRSGLTMATIVRGDANGVTGKSAASAPACLMYALVGGGRQIEMFDGPQRYAVDVESGQTTLLPTGVGELEGQSRNRRFELRSDKSGVWLKDRLAESMPVLLQRKSPGSRTGNGGVSDDGRFAAVLVTGFAMPPSGVRTVRPVSTSEICVWDLGRSSSRESRIGEKGR